MSSRDQSPPEVNKKFRVAVIDDGFDTSLPVLKDKIIAKLTVKCDEKVDPAANVKAASSTQQDYDQIKKDLIASLQNPDPMVCQFVEMPSLVKSPAFQEISIYREEWNSRYPKRLFEPAGPEVPQSVSSNTAASKANSEAPVIDRAKFDRIDDVLSGEGKYIYHGTNVASLIAYKNDNVELVLIQIDLARGYEPEDGQLKCLTQSEIDRDIKLYSDPDVLRANRESPLSPDDKVVDNLFVKYNIDFSNQSFGGPPTKIMEDIYVKNGCSPISLGNYKRVMHEFDSQREISIRERGLTKDKSLTISAFGNDAAAINTPADGEECSKVFTINVGAIDSKDKPAVFTNTGKCSDVMAPGVGIIVSAPDNFVHAADGTSFSSPLFVRHLTQTLKPQSNYKDLYKKLKGSNQVISSSQIPTELLDKSREQLGGLSLTDRVGLTSRPFLKHHLPSNLR